MSMILDWKFSYFIFPYMRAIFKSRVSGSISLLDIPIYLIFWIQQIVLLATCPHFAQRKTVSLLGHLKIVILLKFCAFYLEIFRFLVLKLRHQIIKLLNYCSLIKLWNHRILIRLLSSILMSHFDVSCVVKYSRNVANDFELGVFPKWDGKLNGDTVQQYELDRHGLSCAWLDTSDVNAQ